MPLHSGACWKESTACSSRVGMLFVGHAENFSESKDLFTLRGKTVYERR